LNARGELDERDVIHLAKEVDLPEDRHRVGQSGTRCTSLRTTAPQKRRK
jgi:hypothetical protein